MRPAVTAAAKTASRRAALLRYAAVQFVVLTGCAMLAYPGGTWFDRSATHYDLTRNFLSDLGATRTWGGTGNYISASLFALALVTMGGALVAFAWTWRGFAFARGRARGLGIASAVVGTAGGAAFIGIALAPEDHVLALHNTLVVTAFGLLAAYIASLSLLLWRNGERVVFHVSYLALVLSYFMWVLHALAAGIAASFVTMVVAQKIIVTVSMIYVVYLTTTIRARITMADATS